MRASIFYLVVQTIFVLLNVTHESPQRIDIKLINH